MPSSTLFSTISQYRFPDSREIARGAGRADFIQPSLGPLQPNFDDLMDLDLDLFNYNSRLPSVPEEVSDDIFKTIEYNYPQLMSSINPQTTSTIEEIPNIQQQQQQQQNQQKTQYPMNIDESTMNSTIQYSGKTYAQQHMSNILTDPYMGTQIQTPQVQQQQQQSDEFTKVTNKIKSGRGYLKQIAKREPHNYDSCQPTTYQTKAYNLIISQPSPQTQAQQQQNFQPTYSNYPSAIVSPQQQQQQQQHPQSNNFELQLTNTNPVNLSNTPQSGTVILLPNLNSKIITHSNSLPPLQTIVHQPVQPRSQSMPNPPNVNVLSLSSTSQTTTTPSNLQQQQQQQQHDSFKSATAQASSYKSYHNLQQPYQIPSQSTSVVRSLRHSSPPSHTQTTTNQLITTNQCSQQIQEKSQQQQQKLPPHPTKEMIRSNSLPLNATLGLPSMQKDESFAVPKYQMKPKSVRSRSNSMIIKKGLLPGLHAATSEPMLNVSNSALLAQLLTTSSANNLLAAKQASSSTTALHTITKQQSSQQQQQQQQIYQMQFASQLLANNSPPLVQIQQQQQPHLASNSSLSSSSVLSFSSSSASSASSAAATSSNIIGQVIQTNPNNYNNNNNNSSSPQALSPDSNMIDSDRCYTFTGSSNSGGAGSSSNSNNNNNNSIIKYSRDTSTQRRAVHIHAEQKRRCNIKNGFDMLHSLIPQLQQNPNAKLSKAAMLQKGAEYIKQLRIEKASTNDKIDALKKEIEALNNSLNHLHTTLPANGAPVSRQRTGRVKDLYDQYVRHRTLENWKFWIFGLIFEPLFNSFNSTVSVANLDELCRTSLLWVDQHCSLIELRPAVSNKLRHLSTTTDVLSDPPTSLQEEVIKAISNSPGNSNNNNSSNQMLQ
uniref:Putative basic helix-loop-helix zip transcription factor n=1 Tax=Corethrella appendiculata TaxID=1370023 RepID=U5EPE1_9DIPT